MVGTIRARLRGGTMRKRTKALVCAALSAAGLAVAPGTASAAECSVNYDHICLWVDRDYHTGYGAWAGSVPKLPTKLHRQVSSLKNIMPGAVFFYSGDNYTGSSFCINPGDVDRDLADRFGDGVTWNDRISSFRYFPGGFCTSP
jgi:peptidase inhibitor family I36